jgi:uncharacterized protein (TIGR03067 family)
MKSKMLLLLVLVALIAADGPPDKASKKDLAKMQGDWALVSMTKDGMKVPDDDAQALFRTVKGNEYTVFRYDRGAGKGTFTIDATKKPKTIDFLPANSKDKTKVMLGIYEFDGEKIKYCYAPIGKPWPTEFTSNEGVLQTLAVWEREKK